MLISAQFVRSQKVIVRTNPFVEKTINELCMLVCFDPVVSRIKHFS